MNIKKDVRPPLSTSISVEDFLDYYWLKEELQDFCRSVGLSTAGGKIEITERIAKYLRTGVKEKYVTRNATSVRSSSPSNSVSYGDLTLDTVIKPGFKCTQNHRNFFKSVIGPKFHFSVELQDYIKANVGKTYHDVVEEYYRIQERKKAGVRTTISKQFEYNTFIRDYYDDPQNEGKPLSEAINAWKEVRSQRGANVYRPK
ncbi:DUF6434 domain-containing protein [Bacillus wiedmannii]|uniref:DUF6434 domain-containing protein n=1 Tax=Bacillus wiedmannii TaxID=1890302 RepID=UPI001D0E1E0F|nr:DUF6434 domain-containing protein [Bacillus wiedmannii]MCC2328540.1 SAP domain-containing protein [Bacillus wiedmannii]